MDIELQDCQITHWFFKFITIPSGSLSTKKEAFMECIYSHFGQLTLYADIHTKYSFVTESSKIYEFIKSHTPTALVTYISVILIDKLTLSVINPGWEEVTFDLDILGGQFEYQAKTCRLNGVATIYTLTGPNDMAYNTPGQESVVKVSEKSLKNTKQVKVGPFSANVIVLGTE